MQTHRRARTHAIHHLLVAVGLGLGAAVVQLAEAVPAEATAEAPELTWTKTFAPHATPVTDVRGISCPTASVCYLASTTLRRSADGGRSWQQLATPAGYAVFNDVDCPSATRCTAVSDSGDLLSTSDSGSTWRHVSTGVPPLAFMRPARVACPSASTCFAIGTAAGVPPLQTVVIVSRDHGTTWTRLAIPTTTSTFTGLACPTESACRAVASGEILRTDDGGAHWLLAAGTSGNYVDIACPTSLTCLSLAGMGSPALMRTIDGGATWHDIWPPFIPVDMSVLRSIDCVSPMNCVVVGVSGFRFGGGQGAAVRVDPASGAIVESTVAQGVNGLDVVDCQATHCVSLGRDLAAFATGWFATVTSDDEGAQFSLVPTPVADSVSDVVCWTAERCLAVGQNGVVATGGTTHGLVAATTDAGTSWVRSPLPDVVGPVKWVACASPVMCVATAISADANLAPMVIRTGDGGATWSQGSLPVTLLNIFDIACPSESLCLATANTPVQGDPGLTLRTTDLGETWSVVHTWSRFTSPINLACVDASACLTKVVDAAGAATLWFSADAGVNWTSVAVPPGRTPAAIQCSASGCLLQTSDRTRPLELFVTIDQGRTWSPVDGPATVQRSCGPTGWCVAVLNDAGGHAFTSSDGGEHWKEGLVLGQQSNILGLTCPRETRCFATARGGIHDGVLYRLDLTAGPPAPAKPSLVPLSPVRVLDTRAGGQTIDGQFAGSGWRRPPGSRLEVHVAGRAGVPIGASAVVLNVTATGTAGTGFVTVWPCDMPGPPNSSNLNYVSDQTVPNLVIASLSASGTFCVQTTESSADLLADVNGYFPAAAAYSPVSPVRLLDSRTGGQTTDGRFAGIGLRQPGSRLEVQVTGRAGVAPGAVAVVLNMTATEPVGGGFATVWPCDTLDPPNASNLNFTAGQTVPNLVIASLSLTGTVCMQTTESAAHVLADVSGYFPAGTTFSPLAPLRVLDTREGGHTSDGRFAGIGLRQPGSRLELTVADRAGVPAGAVAVVLNVTVTGTAGGGYATVWPCDGAGPPNASNLNFTAGQTVPNLVIAPLSPTGTVCVQTAESGAHLLADVSGYFRTNP